MPAMKDHEPNQPIPLRPIGIASLLSVVLLWFAQPPAALWPLAMVALAPLVHLVTLAQPISRRGYLIVWSAAFLYWLVSLQGLRYAHWAMHFCWIALSAYLAAYHLLFLASARAMVSRKVPLDIAVAVAWTGQECLRGYLLTGISACLLGHTLADVPILIQVADLLGSYGVSFVIAALNVGIYRAVRGIAGGQSVRRFAWNLVALDVVVAAVLIGLTTLYGSIRLRQPLGESLGTFALVQRSEPVEYGQPIKRESEIFSAYATDTLGAVGQLEEAVDAIIWPESMFTAGNPWMMADRDALPPPSVDPGAPVMTQQDLQRGVAESREYFLQRAGYLLDAIASQRPGKARPHLIVGSGVVHYRRRPEIYCGVIHIGSNKEVADWYGKTHLVMFGEYIPILPHLPGLKRLVPPGLGLATGPGPKRFRLGDTVISPNICIETAVERVTVNQLSELRQSGEAADLVVTVTNDGWFDDSSVIDHHRRCAQLVAVGCRRPILSAANNGPTVWIDSRGQIIESIEQGGEGVLIAKPEKDSRTSWYLRIGDWPARGCALASVLALLWPRIKSPSPKSKD